ncbi:MAG: DNA cytosine methyltransferase [Prevotella sp.]|nr:DNA cytosine methyltransferase [Prevotella sp.]
MPSRSGFDQWRGVLSDLGYDSDYRVLNAKDFGVPQNRERVFCLSWRRDMGLPHAFPWPQPVPLTRTIADVLEPDADSRYFLKPESVTAFLQKNESEQMIYVTTDHKPSSQEIDDILAKVKSEECRRYRERQRERSGNLLPHRQIWYDHRH